MSTPLRVLAALALVCAPLAPAFAQDRPPAGPQAPARPEPGGRVVIEDEAAARADPNGLVAAAAELVNRNLLDQAGTLLDRAEEFGADAQSLRFQRARLAEARGDLEAAAGFYRQMLLQDPNILRVRLELGRVYFLLGDDRKSALQFNYALAGDLPEPVVQNVRRFLRRIDARRLWGFDFDFAFAPDTNVNAATSRREVSIFDLPFELDDDARETSGIGIDVKTSGRFDVPLTDNRSVLLRQTAFVRRLDYEGGDFDDTNLALSAGPLVRLGNNQEVSASALFGRRWFGDEGYSHYLGMRAAWQGRVTDRVNLGLNVQGFRLKHDEAERLDGPRFLVGVNPLYSLTPQSLLRGSVTLDRVRASDPTERSVGLFLGIGLFTELPFGFNVYAEPGIEFRKYDSNIPGFGFDKKDSITYSFEVNLRNRQLDFFGFTPLIGTVLGKTRLRHRPVRLRAGEVRIGRDAGVLRRRCGRRSPATLDPRSSAG